MTAKAGSKWEKVVSTIPWHLLNDADAPKVAPQAAYTPPVAPSADKRWAILALVTLAVTLGIVVFAASNFIPPRTATVATIAPTTAPPVVYVERVITATAMPTEQPAPQVIIVTLPPPVYAQPAAQPRPVQRQPARSLPAPTQAPPPAWPAPQQQVTIVDPARPASQGSPSGAYSCTGFGPCPPPKREPQPTPKPHYIDRDPDDFDRFLDWMFNTQSVKKGR